MQAWDINKNSCKELAQFFERKIKLWFALNQRNHFLLKVSGGFSIPCWLRQTDALKTLESMDPKNQFIYFEMDFQEFLTTIEKNEPMIPVRDSNGNESALPFKGLNLIKS